MRLAILAVALLLVACQPPPPPRFLSQPEQSRLESVELIVVLPRSDTAVMVAPPTRTHDAVMSRRTERAAAVDRAMATLDFRSIVTAALRDELAKARHVPVRFERRVVAFPSAQGMAQAFDRSSASAVLFVEVVYFIDHDGLVLKADAGLFPKAQHLKPFRPKPDEANPIARGNALFFQSSQRTVSWVGIDYGSPPHLATEITNATAGLAAQLALLLDHGTSP